jgi:hypothetical protein
MSLHCTHISMFPTLWERLCFLLYTLEVLGSTRQCLISDPESPQRPLTPFKAKTTHFSFVSYFLFHPTICFCQLFFLSSSLPCLWQLHGRRVGIQLTSPYSVATMYDAATKQISTTTPKWLQVYGTSIITVRRCRVGLRRQTSV